MVEENLQMPSYKEIYAAEADRYSCSDTALQVHNLALPMARMKIAEFRDPVLAPIDISGTPVHKTETEIQQSRADYITAASILIMAVASIANTSKVGELRNRDLTFEERVLNCHATQEDIMAMVTRQLSAHQQADPSTDGAILKRQYHLSKMLLNSIVDYYPQTSNIVEVKPVETKLIKFNPVQTKAA